MKRRALFILTGLILLLFVAGCNSEKKADQAVAEVNGTKITQKQYDERYALLKTNWEIQSGQKLDESADAETIKSLRESAYNQLVIQEIIKQQAAKEGIKVSDKELQQNLDTFKENQNKYSVDGYKTFLEKYQMTEKQLLSELENQLLSDALRSRVSAAISVSDADVKKYYDENPDKFKEAGGIQISHILVEDQKQAVDEITTCLAQQELELISISEIEASMEDVFVFLAESGR